MNKLGQSALLFLTLFHPILATADAIVLHCGKVINTQERRIEDNQSILVRDGVIQEIGSNVDIDSNTREFDLRDRYCAPGLIDSHTHLAASDDNGLTNYHARSSASKTLQALKNAQTMLDLGFTTLRIPGDLDHHFGIVDLRDAIGRGDFVGPRLLVAPHLLSPTGGHDDYRYLPADLEQHVSSNVVPAGEDQAREAVRKQIRGGADWIKITASGGVMSSGDDPRVQGFTDGEINAFAEETHRYGKKITAHVHGDTAAYSAAKAKFDSIEHGTMISDRTIREMKNSGTYLVPTLYVLDWIISQGAVDSITEEMLEKAKEVKKIRDKAFKKAYKKGVKIAYGVDQIFSHKQSLNEFYALRAQGVSNWDAIAMATVNGADLLGLTDQIGHLAPGKLADVIALPQNPSEDLSAFESVNFVMKSGQVIRQQ